MHPLRHYGGFVLAGGTAFVTDVAVFTALHEFFALSALFARLPAIACAMVVSWLLNRWITFAMPTPPTWGEFADFCAVSWVAQLVNYAVFAVIILLIPNLLPIVAITVACLVAMFISYVGYRFGVFHRY